MEATMGTLDEFIMKDNLECLNSVPGTVNNAFTDGDAVLESQDDDNQLLVKVTFRSPVNVGMLKISSVSEDETMPSRVRLFKDKPDMSFGEAEDDASIQDLTEELTGAIEDNTAIPLRFVKFQNVTTLQMFIADNRGGDGVTKIKRIQFLGTPANKMDMKDWKPCKS
jgi:hypothetical protein